MPSPLSRRALWMQKLADEVALGISEQIRDGSLPQGAPLPSFEDLCAHYITTQAVVERALHDLSDVGLIKPEPDGGFHVAASAPTHSEFTLPEDATERLEDVLSILELRLGIESEGAALAAARRDASQMEEIAAAEQAYSDASRTADRTAQADFRFHRSIAAASGNPYLLELMDYLGPLLIPRMRLPQSTSTTPDALVQKTLVEHAALVEAIYQKDADAARRAMRAHLARTIETMRDIGTAKDSEI